MCTEVAASLKLDVYSLRRPQDMIHRVRHPILARPILVHYVGMRIEQLPGLAVWRGQLLVGLVAGEGLFLDSLLREFDLAFGLARNKTSQAVLPSLLLLHFLHDLLLHGWGQHRSWFVQSCKSKKPCFTLILDDATRGLLRDTPSSKADFAVRCSPINGVCH